MANKEDIKNVHDAIADKFGRGQSKLLAFMYQWAEQATGGSPTCFYPTDPEDPRDGAYELAVANKHMAGVVRAGIFLDEQDPRAAMDVVNRINRIVFDLSPIQVTIIVQNNQANREKKDEILFNKALSKYISQMPADKILSTPGVYDAMKEEYEDAANDIVKRYQADPGLNNIEIKYDTREILEMAIIDLEGVVHQAEKGEDINRDALQDTIDLAKSHLEAMDQIMNESIIK